jgi:protein-tyrosine phosphatase
MRDCGYDRSGGEDRSAGMSEVVPPQPERIVGFEGARNLRDLGGYPADDGRRVRWGVLYRSGALSGLAAAGWEALRARGVRAVCDLRTVREREADPFPHAGEDGLAYRAGDCRASFAELGETIRSGFPTGEAARAGMIAGYRELPFEMAPAYRPLFACLKAGETPLVFNCVAGKDRAGGAAALILTALGVPRETVVEDYLLTNQVYDVEATLRGPREGRLARYPEAVGAAIARADRAYLEAALEAVDARCGGIEGFLESVLDVGAGDLRRIRDRLLE